MRRRGVTLMELMIAITLLGLLVAAVLTAMRVGFHALERTNSRVIANRRAVGAQRVLRQEIAGFLPVSAECIASGGPAPTAKIGFFQGDTQTMRFVSTYSLNEAARGLPRILEFTVIEGDKGVGVRLVVNERFYSGPLSTGSLCLGMAPDPEFGSSSPRFVPVETGPGSFVLADKLAACRFSYREARPAPEYERWLPRWPFDRYPSAVRIEMTPLEADTSKILPAPLTVPILVNRVPLGNYFD